jgi:hypothetical protein
MSEITPVKKEVTINKPTSNAKEIIITKLLQLKGKVVRNDDTQIECEFGSHIKSKLLGELFVSGETLPKKAIIYFTVKENDSTQISIEVTDRHKFGFKAGLIKKYEQALQDLANSIAIGFE